MHETEFKRNVVLVTISATYKVARGSYNGTEDTIIVFTGSFYSPIKMNETKTRLVDKRS